MKLAFSINLTCKNIINALNISILCLDFGVIFHTFLKKDVELYTSQIQVFKQPCLKPFGRTHIIILAESSEKENEDVKEI